MQRDHTEYDGYMKANFEIKAWVSDAFTSNNKSLIGRVCNLLVEAIRSETYLPKLIVLALDDDLVSRFDSDKPGNAFIIGKALDWLMREFGRIISAYKEYLPVKAKRNNFPHFIWIKAPYHCYFENNSLREKYNNCLKALCMVHDNMSVLQLKKIWNAEDTCFFIEDPPRYTGTGLKNYWEAVHKSV